MKKLLFNNKAAIILLVFTILSTCFYAYMLARPVSYGMPYHTETVYETTLFEGTMTFYPDNTVVNSNSNFDGEIKSYYFYKNGYVFLLFAQTEEEYQEEVAFINENFEDALSEPFYADSINAFELEADGMGDFSTVYTCTPALIFAVVYGIFELILIGLTSASLMPLKKDR